MMDILLKNNFAYICVETEALLEDGITFDFLYLDNTKT